MLGLGACGWTLIWDRTVLDQRSEVRGQRSEVNFRATSRIWTTPWWTGAKHACIDDVSRRKGKDCMTRKIDDRKMGDKKCGGEERSFIFLSVIFLSVIFRTLPIIRQRQYTTDGQSNIDYARYKMTKETRARMNFRQVPAKTPPSAERERGAGSGSGARGRRSVNARQG